MSDEFEAVVAHVRRRVVPTEDERDRLDALTAELVEAVEVAIGDLPVEAEVILVGSVARRTWLPGNRDVDIFVRFPPDISREELEEYGLAVGHEVLPDGREEFAEHPYVTGEYAGFAVDLVPCYAVDDAANIRSAVDRTPFHSRYLTDRIEPYADEVRIAKQFLTAMGAYGSDLRTRGYSGYLVELLVMEFGGFQGLIEAAADWYPPVRIDIEGHSNASFDDPLVVVDPTDPGRNVASVLSEENLARLIHYSRELLRNPRISLFESQDPDPLNPDDVRRVVRRRGTTPIAVRFKTPVVVEDQLYPQLGKALTSIVDELARQGFEPLRSAAFAGNQAVLFVECEVDQRPAIEHHEGPPIGAREHAENFYDKYAGGEGTIDRNGTAAQVTSPIETGDEGSDPSKEPRTVGPFLEGDRYVVERPRTFQTPQGLLTSDAIYDVALGPDVERALREQYEVLVGDDVAALAEEFGTDLAQYFDPHP